jgi:tetratricopeptide (TPR) repeat protein
MKKLIAIPLVVFALVSCNRDPNIAKRRYLENGNKYFDRGKFKEASIMYRQALQKDLRFGPAHYRLALAELKLQRIPNAVGSLRRAIELLPVGSPEHTESTVKLCEIYLALAPDKQFLKEVETMIDGLLKRDANSYEAHRLLGDLSFVRARRAAQARENEQASGFIAAAIEEYRKADSIKKDQPYLVLALGRALATNRQLPEAEAQYRRVMQLDKKITVAHTELYQLYAVQNRLQEAEQILKDAFTTNPKEYGFLTQLAMHYYIQRRRDDMVKVLDQLKSHHNDFPKNSTGAYVVAGDFFLRLGDPDGAVGQYRAGMKVDNDRKATYQKRIIEVLMRQGKRAEAAQINDEILKDNPRDNDARGLAASLMLDKGDVQRAMQDLQSVVTAAPNNFVARFNLGRAHMAKGETEQARQQFTEAIRLRPDYIPPRLALSQLHIMRREFDNALTMAGEVLKFDRNSLAARLLQSAALMGQQKFAESRALLGALLKNDPNSSDAWFQLGLVNLAEKRYSESEEGFRKAYQLNPANTRGLLGMVETYMAQGKPEQALQILQAESGKYPDRSDLMVLLGNNAVRSGKYDYAIDQFRKVLTKVDPKSRQAGDIHLRIGETYRRKGDLANGVASLQKAAEVIPNDRFVLHTLALTLDTAGRRDEARQAYEQVLKIDPNNGVAMNNLAYLMAETGGDLNQALTYAQRAKQRLPNLHEVSDTLGWIYLKKNLSDSAIDIFRDLVTKAPKHSTYRYHLGMALSQKGDKVNALKELNEALKSSPPREEAAKIKELIAKLG